jgi:2-polyprenyl-6-methoxyphenol hydroxylase-like FAD-dependent oxidoreductase
MSTSPHVLIAGAGIGGLTTALTLHTQGLTASVIERAETLQPLGLGINLLPHAVRELSELGLGEALSRIAVAPTSICYFGPDGTLLFREPRGLQGGYGWPQYSVHRGQLQMLLLDAVRNRLGAATVRTGVGATGFTQAEDEVVTHTTAGDVASAFLVGADGVRSTLRRQLHPGDDPLMWSGVMLVRGATQREPFLDGRTMAVVKASDGVELVVYPIGGGSINWILKLPRGSAGPLPGDVDWNAPASRDDALDSVAGWDLPWLDASDLIGRTETILGYPMVDRAPLPTWGAGRVTLLGDAAHPMYPVGSNGGSQSILDASTLADHLARAGEEGLRTYEANRRAETAGVVAANREMYAAEITPQGLAAAADRYRVLTRADEHVS